MSDFGDKDTKALLRIALTGADDELSSLAVDAMDAAADDIEAIWLCIRDSHAADYDVSMVVDRISTRLRVAAEVARRELAAAQHSGGPPPPRRNGVKAVAS